MKGLDLCKALELFDVLIEDLDETYIDCDDKSIVRIREKLEDEKVRIAQNPTGSLWVQYMSMVDLLRSLLKSQRTGQFMLYLRTLQKMLPFYAATGHSNYAKSGYIYIQDMLDLEESNPDIFQHFVSGLFVIRRTERFWAGLPTDLIIEQVLMRSLKTTGGLTHERGMDEKRRIRWLLAMPACAEVNEMMQELTGKQFSTSEQHKDMTDARRTRDNKDAEEIFEILQDHNPFEAKEELHNIATGVTGVESANPHKAVEVGMGILNRMEGQNAFQFTFRKKDQVETLGLKVLSSNGETLSVDPQLLFQRLLIIANNSDCSLDELFKYELSTHPPALFNKKGLLLEPNKPQLADAFARTISKEEMAQSSEKPEFSVLDGGSLLHRLSWEKGATFDEISDKIVTYVKKNFTNPTVVFDGYTGPSVKDVTHHRRSKGTVGPKVLLSANLPLKLKKEHFLANSDNKQNFINLLDGKLQASGIPTLNADGDADLLIAKTGVDYATTGITHVIGEDTDVLVLLCHHAKPGTKGLYFRSEKSKARYPVWNILLLREKLGEQVCHLLPFIHALCGCDTTSRLFGIGKGTALKKAQTDELFVKQAEVFCSVQNSEAIREAGEKALVHLYGGRVCDTLNVLRKKKFSDKVSKSITCVEVQSLPPTSDAAKYHSYRVYYQVQVWMGKGDDLKPENWGWILRRGEFEPKTMDSSQAPESLLKFIRCQCKGDCDSKRCSCRKHELECSSACYCKGVSCQNISDDAREIDDVELGVD